MWMLFVNCVFVLYNLLFLEYCFVLCDLIILWFFDFGDESDRNGMGWVWFLIMCVEVGIYLFM